MWSTWRPHPSHMQIDAEELWRIVAGSAPGQLLVSSLAFDMLFYMLLAVVGQNSCSQLVLDDELNCLWRVGGCPHPPW